MSPDYLFWRPLLTALLLTACVSDVRARRIPNALTLLLLGAGLVHALVASASPAMSDASRGMPMATHLGAALVGAALGLVAWLPLYALGVLGAGDVKLLAASAAWFGPTAVLPVTVGAALAGGVLGVVWLLLRLRERPEVVALIGAPVTCRIREPRLPYGIAVAAGVLVHAWGGSAWGAIA